MGRSSVTNTSDSDNSTTASTATAASAFHSIRDRFPFKRNNGSHNISTLASRSPNITPLSYKASRSHHYHRRKLSRCPFRGKSWFYLCIFAVIFTFALASIVLQSSISSGGGGDIVRRWRWPVKDDFKLGSSLEFVRFERNFTRFEWLRNQPRIGVRPPRIGLDPIIGINQSRGQLWSWVAEKYNKERRSDLHPRPQRSIVKRIGSILTSVAHLRGCVRQIENLNPSGASKQDIMNRAKILYAQESKDNKLFPFDHVWNIVKDCEKIAGDKIHPTKKSKTRATYLDTSQSDTPLEESPQSGSPMFSTFLINLSDDNIGDSSERPIGVKKAKSKKKRDEDISNSTYNGRTTSRVIECFETRNCRKTTKLRSSKD